MLRILHVLPRLYPGGGIESFFMNYFRHLDHEEFKIDVICHEIKDDTYAKEIRAAGGSVTVLPQMTARRMFEMPELIDSYFRRHAGAQYDIIHCNMANAAYMYLSIAKKYGVPVRILHSHQSEYADRWSHKIRNIPLIKIGKKYATHYVAASHLAGDFLFGKKHYEVIPNAIDVQDYAYSEQNRCDIRKALGLSDSTVLIGCVGRLTPQKNQQFALDIIQSLDNNIILLCLGDGEMLEQLKTKTRSLGIEDRVIFLGNVTRIVPYYSAMDMLLMPSLYEGLPVALIEAQAAGLPALVSSGVSSEAKLSEFVMFQSATDSATIWAQTIENKIITKHWNRSDGFKQVREHGFDIIKAANWLSDYYRRIVPKA